MMVRGKSVKVIQITFEAKDIGRLSTEDSLLFSILLGYSMSHQGPIVHTCYNNSPSTFSPWCKIMSGLSYSTGRTKVSDIRKKRGKEGDCPDIYGLIGRSHCVGTKAGSPNMICNS